MLLLLPSLGLNYGMTRQVILTLLLALIVSGLNLNLGYAGELAMGHIAMYAAGAYTAGLISKAGITEIWAQLLAGALAALVVGLVSGIPGLRLGGWSLAMTSFFLILLIPDVLSIFKESTGGRNGLTGIAIPTLFGEPVTENQYYILVVVIAILWFAFMRNVVVSRHGTAFQVLKQSPVLASSVGISVFRMKLSAYALGAIPAGLAGVLFANLDMFISPEAFTFTVAMTVLAASVFGGSASVYGALVGAGVLQFGLNQATNFQEYGLIITGGFLLFGGVLFSGGIAGVAQKIVRKLDYKAAEQVGRSKGNSAENAVADVEVLQGANLSVQTVSKAFGGNKALSQVSLEAKPGAVTAIIGPNGSGKTTLLNMISGYYETDEGVIALDDLQIQGLPSYKVARSGVSRTFQTPNIPKNLSVIETVESGRYSTQRASILQAVLRTPKFRRIRREDRSEAQRVLNLVGLGSQLNADADSLPLGNRRLLEVARSLIGSPKVILLDEVASGLDEDELDVLADLILRLREAGLTVVIVEHNFQLVLRLADVIYVLAQGSVMAHGAPAEIEKNPRVMEEYLGIVSDSDGTSLVGA
ncbi:branched-chain amino acid ABC transporter ATP-binding protein/permease [Glutamicibacter protophormiae]|uniref:branched-chain amino acid ABC transporter ATP-binding protein/permease n=1 Tax=Glutamicibacter protophormiae TaxID=37930 RepID=UPI0019580BE2|nr:branched-chain amino acid ABC transporter ATP-binding protein/permease [Glutamicibacter protophormiae]QRQ78529.1 branched-chain amino acid ABC transporter ATP-binding protein/permease [Glutamicibacter protophormiae]